MRLNSCYFFVILTDNYHVYQIRHYSECFEQDSLYDNTVCVIKQMDHKMIMNRSIENNYVRYLKLSIIFIQNTELCLIYD